MIRAQKAYLFHNMALSAICQTPLKETAGKDAVSLKRHKVLVAPVPSLAPATLGHPWPA
jgi:hypothetical protein